MTTPICNPPGGWWSNQIGSDRKEASPSAAANRGPLTRELAAVLGEEGLRHLVNKFGGQRLRVHMQAKLDSDLAHALGAETYGALQREFRGEELDIPRLVREGWAERNARIRARAAAGETANQIAAAEGLYLRRVREILARHQQKT